MGVPQNPDGRHIRSSARGIGRVAREIEGGELQCDGAVEFEVLGVVDQTHASAAELLEDLAPLFGSAL